MGKTILSRCCCFDDVRSGSMASAIYTMICAVILVIIGGCKLGVPSYFISNQVANVEFYTWIFLLVLGSLLFIASVLAIFGLTADSRYLLLPYMIIVPVVVLFQCAWAFVYIWVMTIVSADDHVRYLFFLLFIVILALLDVFCILAVVSQYQEYEAGRGRLEDVLAARSSRLNVIATVISQQGACPPLASTMVGAGPPPPGYSIQQPGYPPQQPGYPAQQPGYPAQQPGYPAQQPGYPTQQDYPQNSYAPLHNEQA